MSAPSTRRDPFVGETLAGKYRVVRPIARGGMGRVYEAIQEPLERKVAFKILDLAEHAGQKDFEARFFLEAAACAKLQHPNTVVVFDYGKLEGEPVFFIAMELLSGETLQQVFDREAPIDPARLHHVGLQIAASIGEAHELGMVHRDVKPGNIMLTKRGKDTDFVKVLDFGLVKLEDEGNLTQSGALLGTPRYMSPEQISSSDVGPPSDIYSLGAILYHGLTGRPPFDSDSKFVLLASHINVEPPKIRELQPETPASDALIAVVERCLQKEPEARFGSMEALAEALAACPETSVPRSLSHSGSIPLLSVVPPTKKSDPLADTQAAPPSESSAVGDVPLAETESSESNRRVLALFAAVLLGGAGIAAVLSMGGEDEAPVAETSPELQPEEDPTMSAEPEAPALMAPVVTERVTETPEPTQVVGETTPAGARVMRGEDDLGDTPVTLVIPEGERWELRLSARGHEAREVAVTGGQEALHVRLSRVRRATRPVTMEAMVEPPAMDSAMESMTEAPEGMSPSMTDNRNPWAMR